MTDASLKALSMLRSMDNMQWYVIPLLVFTGYIYFAEIEKRNFGAVYLGVATWAGELIWEMFNGLVLHFTNYAPLWSAPGKSAFVIYVGLNIEITMFFAVAALLLIKLIPKDKSLKILGAPNRIFLPLAGAAISLLVEMVLNKCGLLVWDWWFWRWPHVYLIFIAYAAPAFLLIWANDHVSLRSKRNAAVVLILLAVLCHIIFAAILGWI